MRLKNEMIDYIAGKIASTLLHDGDIVLLDESIHLKEQIAKVICENLENEDRLNEEVEEILEEYDDEIDIHHVNYNKLFGLVKNKLVKERNIII